MEIFTFGCYVLRGAFTFIGEVIAMFNSIEDDINEGLVDYINKEIEDIGWMVISDLPFSAKLKLWKKLISFYIYHIENDDIKKRLTAELGKLGNDIEKLSTLRNKIAHADWDNVHENLFVRVNSKVEKDQVRHNYIKIDESKFELIIDEFMRVQQRLIEFIRETDKQLSESIIPR